MRFLSLTLLLFVIAIGSWWLAGLLREDSIGVPPVSHGGTHVTERAPEAAAQPLDGPAAKLAELEPFAREQAPLVVESAVEGADEARKAASAPRPSAPAAPSTSDRVLAFHERYDGMPTRELRRRANELHEDLERRAVELFRKRYDAGRYEIYPFELDEHGRRLPAQRSTPPKTPDVASTVFEDAPAREWHYVVLPRDEYPDYYADLDEKSWVARAFEQLEGDG